MGKRDLKNSCRKNFRYRTNQNVHRLNVRGLVVRFFAHGKTGLEKRGRQHVWYPQRNKYPPRYFLNFFQLLGEGCNLFWLFVLCDELVYVIKHILLTLQITYVRLWFVK